MPTRVQAEVFPGRNFYNGKGVNWGRFIVWLIPAFLVAGILAEVMARLFIDGHYLIILVPFFAALAVAGMINLAVNKGHCRSPIVGGIAGFCAGFLLYIGHFYLGMIHDFGAVAAGHPEALPTYIRLRMAVEKTHDVGAPDSDQDQDKAPTTVDLYMNWFLFAAEFGLVLFLTTGAGSRRSLKPYCGTCQRWMMREVTQYDSIKSDELVDALRTQSARSLSALSATAPFTTIPNVSLAADYCPSLKEGMPRDCPVFVSVKNINTPPKQAVFDAFEQSKGKALVSGLQINSGELAALAPRFKVFETLAGRSAAAALLPEEPAVDQDENKNLAYAEITPLSGDYAGKIMTRKTSLTASMFSALIAAGLFGGLILALGGLFIGFPDHPPAGGVSLREKIVGGVMVGVGFACFLVSVGISLVNPGFLANRYLRKLFLSELARRTSVAVDANDPDALFVEIVPKLNWGRMMLENASDIGLLVVDRGRRELRFEGDKERWRIPAAAIASCEFEKYVYRRGNHSATIYFAIVRANHRNGFWEAPIRERMGTGLFSGRQKKSAQRLFEAIESIRTR